MFPFAAVADGIVQMAAELVRKGDASQFYALDVLPLAIYTTDVDGFLTYYNPACVGIAGRQPALGQDRWCVTWKLYTADGILLPHEECPMADAIRTKHDVRGVRGLAERPNGSRVSFLPFPTPVVSASGDLLGGVNMLIDMTGHRSAPPRDITDGPDPTQSLLIKQALQQLTIAEIKKFMEEVDLELGGHALRVLN